MHAWQPYPYRVPPLDRKWAHGLDAFGSGTWVHISVSLKSPACWIVERKADGHRWTDCVIEDALDRFADLCGQPDAPLDEMIAAYSAFAGPIEAMRFAALLVGDRS